MKRKQKSLTKKDGSASLAGTEGSAISDTEMLNWLDQQGSKYNFWKVQLPTDYPHVTGCVFFCRNVSSGYQSVREALSDRMRK